MKKIILTLTVVATVLASCKEGKKSKVTAKEEVKTEKSVTDINNVDSANSILLWKGFKPTGKHNGSVHLKKGSLVVENGTLKSGTFLIDMTTITSLDITDNKSKGKLENHLKSGDFFDVAKYPTAKFTITNSEVKEGKLVVTGNLTLKDITKSIVIPAKIYEEDGVTVFKSETFKINRADFNVKYGSKSFFDNLKDKFIDDLMELSFEVKTIK